MFVNVDVFLDMFRRNRNTLQGLRLQELTQMMFRHELKNESY